MGSMCCGLGRKRSFEVAADEISINCKDYDSSENWRNVRRRNISVHMTYVGLPLHLTDRGETLSPPSLIFVLAIPPESVLSDLCINWGDLDIIHQVPQVLPKEIKTRIYAVYVLLRQDSPLKTEIIARGFVNSQKVEETLALNCCENIGNADAMVTNLKLLQNCMDNSNIIERVHPFGLPDSFSKNRTDSTRTLNEYSLDLESITSGTKTGYNINRKSRRSVSFIDFMGKKADKDISMEGINSKRHNLVLQNWVAG